VSTNNAFSFTLTELRSFHGTMRIEELPAPDGGGSVRYLTHGGTRHGQQFLEVERRAEPTTYFGHVSGIGILLGELAPDEPHRIGIIGLGAGVLAAYGRAGDTYRFYELDPLVIEVARREFSFLGDSPATIEVVPGDARLSLEREADQGFDVLVLDAFSSGAIPVHLLTREAFALYDRHLSPRGVLALHLTNRHLDLAPVVQALARESGRLTLEIESEADELHGLLASRWILVTRAPSSRPPSPPLPDGGSIRTSRWPGPGRTTSATCCRSCAERPGNQPRSGMVPGREGSTRARDPRAHLFSSTWKGVAARRRPPLRSHSALTSAASAPSPPRPSAWRPWPGQTGARPSAPSRASRRGARAATSTTSPPPCRARRWR
jgi:hypothetical protein